MPDLIPFQFETFDVRVHVDDRGTPWWEARDICAILGIANIGNAISRLEPEESTVIRFTDALHSELSVRLVNESGLYRLIFRSNADAAAGFCSAM